jgi:hypothetical protein
MRGPRTPDPDSYLSGSIRGQESILVACSQPSRVVASADGPVSSVSKSPESYRVRERDLAVSAEAIMTRTAATAIAMIQRTQSMPGLPLPPNAV